MMGGREVVLARRRRRHQRLHVVEEGVERQPQRRAEEVGLAELREVRPIIPHGVGKLLLSRAERHAKGGPYVEKTLELRRMGSAVGKGYGRQEELGRVLV